MISNKELYDTENVPQVPVEICDKRIEILKEHMAKLLNVHYMHQDNNTINEVEKAIKFWTKFKNGEEEYR